MWYNSLLYMPVKPAAIERQLVGGSLQLHARHLEALIEAMEDLWKIYTNAISDQELRILRRDLQGLGKTASELRLLGNRMNDAGVSYLFQVASELNADHVYFIQAGRSNQAPIKIGVSKDPQRRLVHLQLSHYLPLHLLGTIPMPNQTQSRQPARPLERILHDRFAAWHLRGEWYRGNPALKKFISKHCLSNV